MMRLHAIHAAIIACSLIGRHWFPLQEESESPPPPAKQCRDGCRCAKPECNCGISVAAKCALAGTTLDESKLAAVQDQAIKPDVITVYAPAWCAEPCAWLKRHLGSGDGLTRVEYVAEEVWFSLKPHESYPLLMDKARLKYWCQDPRPGAPDVRPRSIDEARTKLGITPVARGPTAGAINVGTVSQDAVDLFCAALGERGNRVQGQAPYTYQLPLGEIVMPGGAETRWQRTGDVIAVEFTKRPRWRLGPIYQDLARVVIDRSKGSIVFDLPIAPDVTLQIRQ